MKFEIPISHAIEMRSRIIFPITVCQYSLLLGQRLGSSLVRLRVVQVNQPLTESRKHDRRELNQPVT
jgi:hypothetical protein